MIKYALFARSRGYADGLGNWVDLTQACLWEDKRSIENTRLQISMRSSICLEDMMVDAVKVVEVRELVKDILDFEE